jgi:ABC-type nitrate/sulfonate/bicarbonate transport system permease component
MKAASFASRNAGVLGVALFLAAWEAAARLVWRDPTVLPAPTQSLVAAFATLPPGELALDVTTSLGRIALGFLLAATAGVVVGVLCGTSAWVAALARPFIEILRPIPPLAWLPIAIIWFGIGEGSKLFVIGLGAFFPVFTAAWRGTTLVPPTLVAAARTMDVAGARLLWRVTLPAALPDIVAGLRVALGLSFGVLVAAELIAAQHGLGALIMQGRELGQLGLTIFGIVLIGLLSLVADHGLALLARRAIGRWSTL